MTEMEWKKSVEYARTWVESGRHMSVSMLPWMAQFAEVSLRAVISTEYLWAMVMVMRSIGYFSMSVYR
jgi:hypothetical protein